MTPTSDIKLDFTAASKRLKGVARHTPLEYNTHFSEAYGCSVYLKREDLQNVRSYKIRGAYNMISQLSQAQLAKGVVCASAGNHAQGVAFSCHKLKANAVIFMPETTPRQKVRQTESFGDGVVKIILVGDTFDDCQNEALKYASEKGMTFIPPFDNDKIIEGQGTVGVEIIEDLPEVDLVIVPIGGGGLLAGLGTYLKSVNGDIQIIGAEPEGAPSMDEAIKYGKPVKLEKMDRFVDGAAVRRVGDLTYDFAVKLLDRLVLVPEGKICTAILKLYNEDAIVTEPAGALSIAALDFCKEEIKGKKIVCVVSGGNNDIDRMQEIKERSLLYEGHKHYFIIRFPQKPGSLKTFVNDVLGPKDDITRFEFIKKTNRESGPALVGIELQNPEDYLSLTERLQYFKFDYKEINNDPTLFEYLV